MVVVTLNPCDRSSSAAITAIRILIRKLKSGGVVVVVVAVVTGSSDGRSTVMMAISLVKPSQASYRIETFLHASL